MTNRKFLLGGVLVVLLLTGIVIIYKVFNKPATETIPHGTTPSVPASTTANIPPAPATSTNGLKIYTNTEFGFEFQYPEDWIVLEEPHGLGFYSRFELVAAPNIAKSNDGPFLVNVVLPEFADRTFLGVSSITSTVSVAGVSGIKYEYEFEDSPETAIVVPLGQYKVILGTTKPYEDFFNQILATFRFLK